MEAQFNFDVKDDTAGFKEKEQIVKIRKLNKKIGDNLKRLYGYQCQICGRRIGEEYGFHVVEAHHIDYFVKSLNNDASNQIIVCPNHHSIIHDVDPVFDRGKLLYIMYGMKRIGDDVFIFITYHKVGAESEELQYAEGKPDYADAFTDSMIFRWDSQIGKGPESSYMQDVMGAKRKHLMVKKSDAETSFYYMGTCDIISAVGDKKMDNNGRVKDITKVTMKMHQPVREDLLRYLESNLLDEEDKAV